MIYLLQIVMSNSNNKIILLMRNFVNETLLKRKVN